MPNPDALVESLLHINGEARPAAGAATYPQHNPARPSELVGHVARASAVDVDAAVRAAHAAYPAWAALSYAERAAYLRRIADHLVADEADLQARIRLFVREHGKVMKEAAIEMTRLGDRFRSVATYAERLASDEHLDGPPFDTVITRQPRGVAALVVPWNRPLSILGAKLPQALLAGNTVVIKPAQSAALAPAMTMAMMAEMLPPGVINVVTGTSAEIGDALLSHPLVRKINFTGSVAVGKHVMRVAAERLTRVTLELGGNDPALVLEDAEIDGPALLRMWLATFLSAGQVCMALKRLYVHRSRYDEVVEGLRAIGAKWVVGDGLLPETQMGPVNNAPQLRIVTAMLDQARAAGEEVVELGQVPDEALYAAGHFQRPALVLNPDPRRAIVREEQFGPALPILPFDDVEEAIRQANDTEFGLCSSVWTRDRERALAVARRLEAGYTYLNGHGALAQDNRAPFGGVKESGVGRNLGYEGVLEFQEYHAISGPEGWLC